MNIEHGLDRKDRDFKFPEENTRTDKRETGLEKKFEVRVEKEDFEQIETQMDRERARKGLDGGQRIAFEAAAAAELRESVLEENPEADIEKIELTDEDIKKCRERMESDIAGAVEAKRKEGERKGWDEEKIREEIESEQVWIKEFQTSYLKDVLTEEKFKEQGLEPSEEDWDAMVKDLKNKIDQEDQHKAIPRAGHMHNLEPQKFKRDVLPYLNSEVKDDIMAEIEKLKENNPWELGSRVRYVAEFIPELKSRIKIDENDWEKMKDLLKGLKDKKWETEEDRKKHGEKGDFWAVAYMLCNMKKIEGLIRKREIKAGGEA